MTESLSLAERVRETVRRYRLLAGGETVVVGVSGGADSTALLRLLEELSGELRLSIHVAHFNHLLRGDAADDAAFVAAMSRDLGLAYHAGAGETRTLAKHAHLSVEDAARRQRYEFLASVAREVSAEVVATGHTLDDQAETVVMRLLRGSGLRGLGGIPPVRMHGGVRVIRPLIEVPRETLRAYLRARALVWREDPTNRDLGILRNRIREVLIPALEGYNPDVRRTLARLADLLREDALALDELAGPHVAAVLAGGPGAARIALERFARLPPALQRRALREAVRRVRGNLRSISFVHLEGARRMALGGRSGGVLELPDGLRITRQPAALEVSVAEPPRPGAAAGEYRLAVPGRVVAIEFGVQLVATRADAGAQEVRARADHPASEGIVLDRARAGHVLLVRGPRPGDRFAPFGMGGRTKKISDFLNEMKVPRRRRPWVPVLTTAAGEVLWVVGLRAAETARVTERTIEVVYVQARALRASREYAR